MISRNSCYLLFTVLISLLWSCTGFVHGFAPLHGTDAAQPINRSLSEDDIKSAILEGARAAGWQAKALTDGQILATYQIRAHTVHVNIHYTDTYYTLNYRDSVGMKMFCTERDKKRAINQKVSGHENCPGRPAYIHQNYLIWLVTLNESIKFMLNPT